MSILKNKKEYIQKLKKEYDILKKGKESLLDIIFEAELPESVYNSNAIENSTLTIEETEKALADDLSIYIKNKHTQEECIGFIDGYNAAIKKVENLGLFDVIHWVAAVNNLPKPLETVWLSNGKGWTNLGCLIETDEGYHWAESNGVVYQDKSDIVAECESDDLEVVYWSKLPNPPYIQRVSNCTVK